MKVKAIQVRKGNVLQYNNDLYKVTDYTHVTPGKGPAFIQLKMKRLTDGVRAENRFRPDESMERASLQTREHQYLYQEGDQYVFMDLETYEQIHISADLLGDDVYYLLPETVCQIMFHEVIPVGVDLPGVVELKIIETPPALKGATVSSSYKPAKMETGLDTQVPPFIEEGEVIRIDTTTGKYIERAK